MQLGGLLYLIEVLLFSWFAVVLPPAVGETQEAQRWRPLHNECDL